MDEQEDTSGRWSWLKVGGLLSGVAALITAIATIIVAIHTVRGPGGGSKDVHDIEDPIPEVEPPDDNDAKEPSGSRRLSAGETAIGLWPDNRCPYRVTVAELLEGNYRVVFEFGEEKSLPADAVFPMATGPIEIGDKVFATAEELKGRWIPGTVMEKKEGKFHVPVRGDAERSPGPPGKSPSCFTSPSASMAAVAGTDHGRCRARRG